MLLILLLISTVMCSYIVWILIKKKDRIQQDLAGKGLLLRSNNIFNDRIWRLMGCPWFYTCSYSSLRYRESVVGYLSLLVGQNFCWWWLSQSIKVNTKICIKFIWYIFLIIVRNSWKHHVLLLNLMAMCSCIVWILKIQKT